MRRNSTGLHVAARSLTFAARPAGCLILRCISNDRTDRPSIRLSSGQSNSWVLRLFILEFDFPSVPAMRFWLGFDPFGNEDLRANNEDLPGQQRSVPLPDRGAQKLGACFGGSMLFDDRTVMRGASGS
jgi:hypothetical protein